MNNKYIFVVNYTLYEYIHKKQNYKDHNTFAYTICDNFHNSMAHFTNLVCKTYMTYLDFAYYIQHQVQHL